MKKTKRTKHRDLNVKPLAQAVALACASIGAHSVQAAACTTPITTTVGQCTLGTSASVNVSATTGIVTDLINGISVTGTPANAITNSGVIIGKSGTKSDTVAGIYLQNSAGLSGGITNSGTINGKTSTGLQNASAYGGVFGVFVSNGAGITGGIVNSGSIKGSNASYAGGVGLRSGTITGDINNAGLIYAGGYRFGYGIRLINGTGSSTGAGLTDVALFGDISNSGTISAVAGGGGAASRGQGIRLQNSSIVGNITNTGSGVIAGHGTATGTSYGNQGTGISIVNGTISGNINNTGTIAGDSARVVDYGIRLEAGNITGAITNNTSGVIAGSSGYFGYGIALQSASTIGGGIVNSGTIRGICPNSSCNPFSGSNRVGIVLDYGSVLNGGITNHGLIEGQAHTNSGTGIRLRGSTTVLNGGISNDGSIIGNLDQNGDAHGIYARSGAMISGGISNDSGGKIIGGNNAALTATVAANYGYGIRVEGASVSGDITNAGLIQGNGQFSGLGIALISGAGTGMTSSAMFSNVALAGNITNSGTILGSAKNRGTGLKVSNATIIGDLNNSGSITGAPTTTGFGSANGIDFNSATLTGTLTNNSGGLIFGSHSHYARGINMYASVIGAIDNSGNILGCGGATAGGCTAAASNGTGIVIRGSSLITGNINNQSGGLIQGSDAINDGDGILLSYSTVNGGITNAGLITGNGKAIELRNAQILGGVVNNTGGSLLGGSRALLITSSSKITGGISNAGVIKGAGLFSGRGIILRGGQSHTSGSGTTLTVYSNLSLAGGIQNSGTIKGTGSGSFISKAAGITLKNTAVSGGITNNSGGLIQGLGAGAGNSVAAIAISSSTLAGGIINSGTIQGLYDFDDVRGILLHSSTLSGGIVNNAGGVIRGTIGPSGTLTHAHAHYNIGLDINGSSSLTGGISNAGAILGCRVTAAACTGAAVASTGIGINIKNTTVAGGVTNQSGGLVEGTGIKRGWGINFSNSTIDGGIANSGTIKGFQTQPPAGYTASPAVGILINNHSLLASGGIVNNSGGMILGSGVSNLWGTGLLVSTSLVKGGISNAGIIKGTSGYQAYGINLGGGVSASTGSGTSATSYTNLALTGGIQNTGTILGKAVGSHGEAAGIYINSNTTITGGITNGTGGLIQGQGPIAKGIYVSFNNTTLVGGISNAGTIQASGSNVIGIADYAQMTQGDINNSGTIRTCNSGTSGGCTANYAMGIYLGNTQVTGSIINQAGGLISVAGVNSGRGVVLDYANVQGGIVNSGSIQTMMISNPSNQSALGIAVTNSTIGTGIQNNTGGQIAAVGNSNAGGTGVKLSNSLVMGGITNQGSISGAGDGSFTTARGIFIGNGMFASTGTGSSAASYSNLAVGGGIQNSGTIKGSGDNGMGIVVSNATVAGGLTNNSGGLIQGHNGTGLQLQRSTLAGDIVNSGTIQGTGARVKAGVYLYNSTVTGGLTNNAGGVIQATGSQYGNQYGVKLSLATLNDGIVNSGTIQGNARTDCSSTSICHGYGIYIENVDISAGITNNSGGVIGHTGTTDYSGNDGYGIYITNPLNPETVITNNTGGTISSIYFPSSTLVLTGDGVTGNVTGTYLADLVIRNSFTSGGDISGFSTVTVEDAATFNLNNNLSSNISITVGQGSSGILNFAGVLSTGSLTINPGAAVTQTGTGGTSTNFQIYTTTLGAGATLTLTDNTISNNIDGAGSAQGDLVLAGTGDIDMSTRIGSSYSLASLTINDGAVVNASNNINATTITVGQGTSGVMNFTGYNLTADSLVLNDGAAYTGSAYVTNVPQATVGSGAVLTLYGGTGNVVVDGAAPGMGSLVVSGIYAPVYQPVGASNSLDLVQLTGGIFLQSDVFATNVSMFPGTGSTSSGGVPYISQQSGMLMASTVTLNSGTLYYQSGGILNAVDLNIGANSTFNQASTGVLNANTTIGTGGELTLKNQGTGNIDGAAAGQGSLVFAGNYNTDTPLGGTASLASILVKNGVTLTLDQDATSTTFTVGEGSSGVLEQSAGTLTAGTVSLMSGATHNLTGGSVSTTTYNANGILNLTGGGLNAASVNLAGTANHAVGTLTATTINLSSGAIYNLSGGSINATNLNLAGMFNMAGGNLTASTTVANLGFFIAQADFNHNGNLQVDNGGTLQIDSNTGTVTGGLVLSAGSIFATTVNSGAQDDAGSLLVSGNADVSVDAIIDVTVSPDAVLAEDITYTIIQAGGGNLNAPTTVIDDNADFLFTASVAGTNLILTTSYDNAARSLLNNLISPGINAMSPNAQAVLTALIAMIDETTTDKAALNIALRSVTTVDELQQVLDSLAPDVSAAIQDASVVFGRSVVISILNRLTAARSGFDGMTGLAAGDQFNNVIAWAQGFGSTTSQDDRHRVHGYDMDNKGFMFGLDSLVTDRLRLGVAFSYAATNVDTRGLNNSTDMDSYQGNLYASLFTDNWYLDGSLSYGWNNSRSRRHIVFGGLDRLAQGEYDGNQFMLQGVWGKDYRLDNDIIVNPYLGLEYINLSTDNYLETGAGALNLAVNPSDVSSLSSTVGLSIRKAIKTASDKVFVPEAHIGWRYEFLDDNILSNSSFMGGGTAFNTGGLNTANSGINIGGSLSMYSSSKSEFQLKYDYETRSGYDSHSGNLIFRYLF